MERRKFVIGLGSLAAGGAAAMGSGAFSMATVQRDVTVQTTGDANAVVGLYPIEGGTGDNNTNTDGSDGDYAEISNRTLEVTLDELNKDADFTFQDVFTIVNEGTETVNLDRINESGWWESNAFNVLIAEELDSYQDDVGREVFDENFDQSSNPATENTAGLEPGDSIVIGFGFWGEDGVGSWDDDDVPETLTFNLGG
ncbi:DUF1102 family protein (plasmid) [Halalkaliarchaeum sp. AArc-CO]|uniref:hypothetical protein n=1 Tax=Halalkaliarchaeum sp. AArc-CO TaxID=2866381 RepID=UPI00217E324D|nr:hypothetical protein [Halalkaliarchaeum sp. AArc-CO]UWG49266.1 DUF1102 family protein [Halalkaliarchaeum sp. AArc-CO]